MLIVCWNRLALILALTVTAGANGVPRIANTPFCAHHVAEFGVQNILFSSFAVTLSSVQERAVLLAPSHRTIQRVGPRFHTRDAFAFANGGRTLYVGYHTAEIGPGAKTANRSGVHITRFVASDGNRMERDNFSLDLDNQSLRRFVVSHDGRLLATGHDTRDAEDAELVGIWNTGSSAYVKTAAEVEENDRGAVVDMLFSRDDLSLVVAYESALDIFQRTSVDENFPPKPARTILWPRQLPKSEPVLTADPTTNRISVYYGGQSTVLDLNLPLAFQGSTTHWHGGFSISAGERVWHHPHTDLPRGIFWFPMGFGGNTYDMAKLGFLTGEHFQQMPVVTVQDLATNTRTSYAVQSTLDSLAQIEISPDGRWLATLSGDSFCLWNLEDQNHHCTLTTTPQSPKSFQFRGVRFSPDSSSLVLHRDVVLDDNFVPQVAYIPLRTFESIWNPTK